VNTDDGTNQEVIGKNFLNLSTSNCQANNFDTYKTSEIAVAQDFPSPPEMYLL
jgi:hypothetical protein